AHAFTDSETSLREGLRGLQGEVDTLGGDATDSSTGAAHAADELSAHLHEQLDTTLPALEQQVIHSREQLAHMFGEHVAAVDSALTSLQLDAFEPTDQALGLKQSEFADWTTEIDDGEAVFLSEVEAAT